MKRSAKQTAKKNKLPRTRPAIQVFTEFKQALNEIFVNGDDGLVGLSETERDKFGRLLNEAWDCLSNLDPERKHKPAGNAISQMNYKPESGMLEFTFEATDNCDLTSVLCESLDVGSCVLTDNWCQMCEYMGEPTEGVKLPEEFNGGIKEAGKKATKKIAAALVSCIKNNEAHRLLELDYKGRSKRGFKIDADAVIWSGNRLELSDWIEKELYPAMDVLLTPMGWTRIENGKYWRRSERDLAMDEARLVQDRLSSEMKRQAGLERED